MRMMIAVDGCGGEDQVQALLSMDKTLICVFGLGMMIDIMDDAIIIKNIRNIIKDGNTDMIAMTVGMMIKSI